MAVFISLGPPQMGTKFPLSQTGTTVIGRDVKCDIQLNRSSISRFHAQIVANRTGFYLEDTNSTNGTFLNKQRITKRTRLQDGDKIEIHDVPCVFYLSNGMIEVEDDTTIYDPNRTSTQVDFPLVEPGSSELREKLETLVAIARDLGTSLDMNETLPRIIDLLFRMYPQAMIGEIHLLIDGRLLPKAMKHGRDGDSTDVSQSPFDREILLEVIETGTGVVRSQIVGPEDSAISALHSMICMPINCHSDKAIGCIFLETDDAAHPFDESDRELVSTVAILAGQVIGYAQAHSMISKHDRLMRQLETARDIQLSILPRTRPQVLGYKFADYYSAAEEVGGDYFLYEQFQDGKVVLGLADASGKGLSAAMHIVNFAGEVRFRLATSRKLNQAMDAINQFECHEKNTTFITSCICLLDPETHQLAVVNAGHMPPLVKRGDEIKILLGEHECLPFGIEGTEEYHYSTFQLEPGDQIFLYTDGVTEAMNEHRQLYHIRRLKAVIRASQGPVETIVRNIVKDVERFRNGVAPSDDMTIVAFQFKEANAVGTQQHSI